MKDVVCIEMRVVEPKGKMIHHDFDEYTMAWKDFLWHVDTILEELDPDESMTIKFTRRDYTKEEFKLLCEEGGIL